MYFWKVIPNKNKKKIEWFMSNDTGDTKKKTRSPYWNNSCFMRETDL